MRAKDEAYDFQKELINSANVLFDTLSDDKDKNYISPKILQNLSLLDELPDFVAKENYIFYSKNLSVKLIFGETSSKGTMYSGNAQMTRTISFNGRYMFVLLQTRFDYGKTLIRRETIIDKLSNVFHSVDIDIDGYDLFNRNFFCISNNPDKFSKAFSKHAADILTSYDGEVYIEFNAKYCAITSLKPINKLYTNMKILSLSKQISEYL